MFGQKNNKQTLTKKKKNEMFETKLKKSQIFFHDENIFGSDFDETLF